MAIHDGLVKRTYTITTCNLLFQRTLERELKWAQEKEQDKSQPGAKILRLSDNTTKFDVKEELLPWPNVKDTEDEA